MTYTYEIWNGTEWETKSIQITPERFKVVKDKLKHYGFHTLIISNETERNIIQALLSNEKSA